jgi:NADPH:quinone reductase-like Zn-dependent oxidoreductase
MNALLQWLQQGKLAAPAVTTYPFEAVADAHRALESGQTVGKLVLTCGDT